MTAMSTEDDDDDFFGGTEEEEKEYLFHETIERGNHREDGVGSSTTRQRPPTTHCGLSRAETAATAKQYQAIGYHETFEESRDCCLQEGFDKGYRDSFDIAVQIGEKVGRALASLRLRHDSDPATQAMERSMFELTHRYLTSEEFNNVDNTNGLNELNVELESIESGFQGLP